MTKIITFLLTIIVYLHTNIIGVDNHTTYSPNSKYTTHHKLNISKKTENTIVGTLVTLGTAAILSNDPKKNSVWLVY